MAKPDTTMPQNLGVRELKDLCAQCRSLQSGVCSVLSEQQLKVLSDMTADVHLHTQDEYFLEGSQKDKIIFVTSGALAVYRVMSDGRRGIIRFLFEGDMHGISYEGEPSQTIQALEPSALCHISREQFTQSMSESPVMSLRVVEMISNELRTAQERLLALGRKNAAEKLAGFLLWMSFRAYNHQVNQYELTLPMSRTDIADYLGLTIETVSRMFARFRRDGLIDLKGPHHVHVLDVYKITKLAGMDLTAACQSYEPAAE